MRKYHVLARLLKGKNLSFAVLNHFFASLNHFSASLKHFSAAQKHSSAALKHSIAFSEDFPASRKSQVAALKFYFADKKL